MTPSLMMTFMLFDRMAVSSKCGKRCPRLGIQVTDTLSSTHFSSAWNLVVSYCAPEELVLWEAGKGRDGSKLYLISTQMYIVHIQGIQESWRSWWEWRQILLPALLIRAGICHILPPSFYLSREMHSVSAPQRSSGSHCCLLSLYRGSQVIHELWGCTWPVQPDISHTSSVSPSSLAASLGLSV